MSEQRSAPLGAMRRVTTTPFRRAYLATLTRRLFGRGAFPSMGPSAFNHAVAIRIAQMQRPTRRR
jgi:hypothetical protein